MAAGGMSKAQGRQQKKNKAYYALGLARREKNRKRKMRNHIRDNPADKSAVTRYEKDLGRADSFGLSARGKKLVKRAAKAAAAKAAKAAA